jgi:DNA-binding CsgD family transcriptional regulator/Tfp pilus assembly protein PilF
MPSEIDQALGEGFRVLAAGDWVGARDAFQSILESDEVAEALVGLASASYWLADLTVMMQSLERAHAAARRRGDPVMAAGAAMALVGYHKQFFGNTAAARGWLARATRIVETDAPQLRGELLGARSFVTDDPVEAERLAREVVEIGRADGNTDLELLGMTAVGAAMVQQGRMADGLAILDEVMAAAIGGECSSPLTAAHASCMTMLVCASCFDIERATQWVQAMDGFIATYGSPFLDAECRTNYGRVLFENGSWAVADEQLTAAIGMNIGMTPASRAFASGTLAELRIAQGHLEDAARLLEKLQDRDEVVGAVALLHLERGDVALAAALVQRRLDAVEGDRLDLVPLVDIVGRAEIALGHGDRAAARSRAVVELGAANDCDLIVAYGERLLGLALAGTEPTEAGRHLERALAAFVGAEVPYRAGQTRLALAQTLAATDRNLAEREARTALTVFEDLGAGRDADRAAALLREFGVKAARVGPKNIGRLTKRESEVLALLVEGLSNPQIAARLYVSRKTVEHHVARVLSKLEVRTRAQAAALAVQTT